MKSKYLNIIFFVTFSLAFNSVKSQYVFHKLFNYNNFYDDGFSIIQTKDNGYISVGVTFNNFDGTYIVKTDNIGDTIWTKFYDLCTYAGDEGISIVQLPDGTFSVCGWNVSGNDSVAHTYLMKLNMYGDSIWFKNYITTIRNKGVKHLQTEDKGFIILGYTFNVENTSTQIFLIKTDSLGNVQWQQEYGDVGYDYPNTIDFTKDGGYIIGGEFENPATNSYDMFLLKTDSLGNQKWKKSYGSSVDEYTGYAQSTTDGGFIIAGAITMPDGFFNGYMVKTDSLGVEQWNKKYGINNKNDYFINIRQLPDNSYIISGTKYDLTASPSRPRVWLLKTDTSGDTLWTKTYTYYGHSSQYKSVTHDYVEDLQICNDGGFVMTGYIINNYFPAKNDLFILKTDSMGNTCEIDTTTWQGCALLVSVEETNESYKYTGAVLYPNPSSGYVTIKSDTSEGFDFTLYDITGTEIMHTKTLNTQTIYLKGIPQGIYIYRIKTDDKQSKSGRLVIIK